MSKFEEQNQIRLNVISKHNNDLRISIIVSGTFYLNIVSLTISQLKRKL